MFAAPLPLTRGFSTYLDILRVTATLVVIGAHATGPRFLEGFPWLQDFAHDGVIVFFVLSGYVIAYTAANRDREIRNYAVNRAARIYSVALPAVLLVPILDLIAMAWRPDFYPNRYQYEAMWRYIPFFLAFATDLWFFAEDAFSNSPYWSLCYEVWYYVLFAAAFFLRGRWRIAVIGAVLLIMGPRLWLLLPLWAGGAWAAFGRKPIPAPRTVFAATMLGFMVIKVSAIDSAIDGWINNLLGGFPLSHLRYSQYFLGDWLIGALVLLNILAARSCQLASLTRHVIRAPVVAVASFSFSIYLFHMPLLKFFTAAFDHDPASGLGWLGIAAAVILCLIGLGLLTEHQKKHFRTAFAWTASILSRAFWMMRHRAV